MSQETIDKVKADLRAAFQKAIADEHLSAADALDVMTALLIEAVDAKAAAMSAAGLALPDKAPELWENRIGRKENPVTFTRRVYATWIGKSFTRASLHKLDPLLYTALAVWQHRHPEEDFSWLPSNSARATARATPPARLAKMRQVLESLQDRTHQPARLSHP